MTRSLKTKEEREDYLNKQIRPRVPPPTRETARPLGLSSTEELSPPGEAAAAPGRRTTRPPRHAGGGGDDWPKWIIGVIVTAVIGLAGCLYSLNREVGVVSTKVDALEKTTEKLEAKIPQPPQPAQPAQTQRRHP
jgi:outer membrane murein-binding lipoprotein Lpp